MLARWRVGVESSEVEGRYLPACFSVAHMWAPSFFSSYLFFWNIDFPPSQWRENMKRNICLHNHISDGRQRMQRMGQAAHIHSTFPQGSGKDVKNGANHQILIHLGWSMTFDECTNGVYQCWESYNANRNCTKHIHSQSNSRRRWKIRNNNQNEQP